MSIWNAIHGWANGEYVEESILNRPIYELKERTDYLYNLFSDLVGSGTFTSVRMTDVSLDQTDELKPSVNDIVYIDSSSKKACKAITSVGEFVNSYRVTNPESLAIGILVSVNGAETLGTIILFGQIDSDSFDSPVSVADLIQSDETFAPGAYYLSATERGKLTAYPTGPAIYVGQIFAQTSDPTLLDYMVLSPQYKDTAEAHTHSAIALVSQPAGSHVAVEDQITGTHTVNGFLPLSNDDTGTHTGGMAAAVLTDSTASWAVNNLIGLTVYNVTKGTSDTITANTDKTITTAGLSWDTNDVYRISERCRLVLYGNYEELSSYQYTFTLTAENSSNPPFSDSKFDDVFLTWTSSNPDTPTGQVQLRSYETPVSIVSGIVAVLESALDSAMTTVDECNLNRRKWVIDIPEQLQGWRANKQRGWFTPHLTSADQKYSVIVMSGPHNSSDGRLDDTFTVAASHTYDIDYDGLTVTDGDLITISGLLDDDIIFEFDDDGSISDPLYISVLIDAASPENTFRNLVDAINDQGVAGLVAVQDIDEEYVLIGVTDAASATSGDMTVTEVIAAGAWEIGVDASLLVYDKNHDNLVSGSLYWGSAAYYTPITLKNNLKIMLIPYNSDNTATVTDEIYNSNNFTYSLIDEATNAYFIYNVGMHQLLNNIYPPVPIVASSMILNGVELASRDLFPNNWTYKAGLNGIYWYSNRYGRVPWARDWVSESSPGSEEFTQNMVYHNARMAIGTTGIVNSIQPKPGSAVTITKCNTNDPATTGDLMIDVDLSISDVNMELEGYQVYKSISGTKLIKGPVVSQIIAGPGVEISTPVGVSSGRGKVTVGLSGYGLSGLFEVCSLENGKQAKVGMFPYIQLLDWDSAGSSNIESGFTAAFKIPLTVTGNYKVAAYLTVFGEETYEVTGASSSILKYAGIDFSYSVLHDYMSPLGVNVFDNLLEDAIGPSEPLRCSIALGTVSKAGGVWTAEYVGYDPQIIHNNDNESVSESGRIQRVLGRVFPKTTDVKNGAVIDPSIAYVTGGSIVAIRVVRAPASREYTNKIGFINMTWRLISA